MFCRRKYRRFYLLFCVSLITLSIAHGLFEYYIDPMWCFRHANRYNCVQQEIDDRQQKTNYLKFRGETYDTLIIGNSRVRMMNQGDFGPHAFNYALAGMIPSEYEPYIDFAKKVNNRDFKQIVLGLSFAHANSEVGLYSKQPSYYFRNVENPLYRFSLLFTGDLFLRSMANIRHAKLKDLTVYFDRNNVQHIRKERVQFDKNLASDLANSHYIYHHSFHYMEQYRSILESIKKHNPSSKITVFTTPVSQPLYCSMITEGRLNDYKRWLRDLVDVFGEIHHFECLNTVTRDYRRYYIDGHHFYPETGTLIAHRLTGVDDPAIPADFDMVLTRSNIEEKLREIEAASKVCR